MMMIMASRQQVFVLAAPLICEVETHVDCRGSGTGRSRAYVGCGTRKHRACGIRRQHHMRVTRMLGRLTLGVAALVALVLAAACLVYPPVYVYRVLVWQESDSSDWRKFPAHPLTAAPLPLHLDVAPDPRIAQLFRDISDADDWERFLAAQHTQAFIVIQDGTILYEQYFNQTQRDSVVTSFSVAKSFTSALIGFAIPDGAIHSVDDPITVYLPELAQRDPGFRAITIRHLLLMASGLEYQAFRPLLLNGDDPLTSYFPDQRRLALDNTHIIDPPDRYFRYNKYHPQLLGMILERSTGMSVTQYLQTRIWDPLGMEYAGSWSIDSRASDFEKMETGVNARAIDFAKFGVLFANGGVWQGKQVLAKAWVEESTQPHFPHDHAAYYPAWLTSMPGGGYYRYMWWGMARADGTYDVMAEGDKGQFIYLSPAKKLVIVRNGTAYGLRAHEWLRLFYAFADQY
jgi:CubicO group peptidase (beta-lactamase class C family)